MNSRQTLAQRLATANPVRQSHLNRSSDADQENMLYRILASERPTTRADRIGVSFRLRAVAVTAVALVVVLLPAVTVARHFGLFGLTNEGQRIDRTQLSLSELSGLDESGFAGDVRLLGRRAGVAFYAAAGRSGGLCFATGSASGAAPKLNYFMGCQRATSSSFPSPKEPILDLSPLKSPNPREVVYVQRLAGFAADGVARVAVVGLDGSMVHTADVADNIYATEWFSTDIPSTTIVALDREGHVLYRKPLLLPRGSRSSSNSTGAGR